MLLNSKPTRYLVTRVARAYGFLDPVRLLGRLRQFAQASEVGEPIELLRAGLLFHARGLLNTKAIQHNLDWVWPFWVEQQFNPNSASFIPRAFSFSHINLTHRNWTAVGLPDVPFYPIVDPRGLVTPLFDGWSLDFWLLPEAGERLLPSKLENFKQELLFDENLHVRSSAERDGMELTSDVRMCLAKGEPQCCINVTVNACATGYLAVALRPFNPEGVSLVESVKFPPGGRGWLVNKVQSVDFSRPPERQLLSNYAEGDVSLRLAEQRDATEISCPAGMATAVALFPVESLREHGLEIRSPIFDELAPGKKPAHFKAVSWKESMAPLAKLQVPDERIQRLYDQALANLVLHSPKEVYPGPYTYKRFWFRDAVYILNALVTLGGVERTRRVMHEFTPRQRRDGYFLSQEGEWDSNGEALWFFHRFAKLTGEKLPEEWLEAVARGARWITRKRLPKNTGKREAGLLPAGFSAEHLGPNDFYYWDDFWAVSGLRAAHDLLRDHRKHAKHAEACAAEAEEFLATIMRSVPSGPHRRFPGSIPASPYRRMDSGAIGSIVADYPLHLFPAGDESIIKTVDFLRDHSSHGGAFYQDMIHSGVNIYLTLHLAQIRLRANQPDAMWTLVERVIALASPTGQWPEAVHPRTGGGCMGDGQHIWAASDWLMMVRNLFVREEGEALIIGSGLKTEWLKSGELSFGPTLTPHGAVSVRFITGAQPVAHIIGQWRNGAPARSLYIPGYAPIEISAGDRRTEFALSPL
ncbi:hypothetical protein [Oleiharenicola lentus]|uniref:hypothetical protein n=1 Tax=Oleiharenicola lentus TaxID=2508720 RepID=UPI003F67A50F